MLKIYSPLVLGLAKQVLSGVFLISFIDTEGFLNLSLRITHIHELFDVFLVETLPHLLHLIPHVLLLFLEYVLLNFTLG